MNNSQLEAVTNTEGPVLIIAGPGSGKTSTLVNRIVYLLVEKNVSPERILVSTFTRKASLELQSRLLKQLREIGVTINVQDLLIGTLHSICLSLIEKYLPYTHLKKGFRLLDDFEQQHLVYRNLEQFMSVDNVIHLTLKDNSSIDPTPVTRSQRLIYWINKVNEEMINVDLLIASEDQILNALGEVYKIYESLLAKENAIDFSFIQTTLVKLFNEHPSILTEVREHIQYVMIDEYQDTNTVQEYLILLLAGKHRNICVVGDDDQSIYRFRGATVQNLLRFTEHFEKDECKIIELDINYRSHPRIINFFTSWINRCNWLDENGNTNRLQKTIIPNKEDNGKTSRVIRVTSDRNVKNWHHEVYNFLTNLMEKKIISDWNQVAFLFWSVKSPSVKLLTRFLESKGIPVFAPRTNAFFERDEVQLVLGAFSVILSELVDSKSISPYFTTCEDILRERVSDSDHISLINWVKKTRKNIEQELTSKTLVDLFYEMLEFSLFREYMSVQFIDNARESRKVRNLAALTKWIIRFEELYTSDSLTVKKKSYQFFRFIEYVKEVGQDEYEDEADYAPSGSLPFYTFHQSKGLEFPVVVVGSLESTPYENSDWIEELLRPYFTRKPYEPIDKTSTYDFYRLFYTAFSRAQELLVLTGNEQDYDYRGRGKLPSDYIEPLFRKLKKWNDPIVYLDELKITTVKPILQQKSYSYTTDIALYNTCPRKYLLKKIYGFQSHVQETATIGTVIHFTLEDLHQAYINKQFVSSEMIIEWIKTNYLIITKTNSDQDVVNLVFNHIQQYIHFLQVEKIEVLSTEHAISGFIQNYLIKATIDAIVKVDDEFEIFDFKTGSNQNNVDALMSYKSQLLLYTALWEQKTGNTLERMRLIFTGESKGQIDVNINRIESDLEKVKDNIGNTLSKIESNLFSIDKPNLDVCHKCEFKYYCIENNKI